MAKGAGVRVNLTATVITSSIGRPELRQCIESVRAQTYGARYAMDGAKPLLRHMVFVNGPKFHDSARAILKDYPDVEAFYLREETGDYGYGTREAPKGSMADVFAAAPFLTRADWVFYLDDDNFYEPDHVESVLTFANEHDLAWAYTLRKLVDIDGRYICDDDWVSIGAYRPRNGREEGTRIIDNSCFAVALHWAKRYGLAWTALPIVADRCFQMALSDEKNRLRHGCTGRSTVNYRLGTGSACPTREEVLATALDWRAKREAPGGGGFPWRVPEVFGKAGG